MAQPIADATYVSPRDLRAELSALSPRRTATFIVDMGGAAPRILAYLSHHDALKEYANLRAA
ncbi:MAG TPA: hypothetical protein VG267_12565 [Terracidiphilus sp.]|nr:hypothetical protein [Terracidiphilus sp.]